MGNDGQIVEIGVVDKRKDKYDKNVKTQFKGERLGGGHKPIDLTADRDLSKGAIFGATADEQMLEDARKNVVAVDESKAKTSIMIRFGDGKRVSQEFNECALVVELFKFVEASTGTADFRLVEGFPPKPIADKSKTLKDSGLLKAQV